MLHRFASAVEHLASVLVKCKEHPLQWRLERLHLAYLAVLSLAFELPPAANPKDSPPSKLESTWPGLGRFDEASPLLLTASRPLLQGLVCFAKGDEEQALSWWSGRLHIWAPLVASALPSLTDGHLAFRQVIKSKKKTTAIIGLTAKGVLGVRFECLGGLGLLVNKVHPSSPAAGLAPGDVILSVDEVPMSHTDLNAAKTALVGRVGERRTYEVYRDGETLRFVWSAVDKLS